MYLVLGYSLMKFSGEDTAVRIPLYDNEQAFTVSCPLHGGRRTLTLSLQGFRLSARRRQSLLHDRGGNRAAADEETS